MTRFLLLTMLALAMAIGGGTASVWYALEADERFDAERIGPWTAYPGEGRLDAGPYAVARRARNAELPLGQAEGLAFYARTDAQGRPLLGTCNYQLEGNVPAARFWTLHVSAGRQAQTQAQQHRRGLHSRQILRRPDSSFLISAGPRPMPGNWIPVNEEQSFMLVLTLFDTPVTSTLRISEQEYPAIRRTDCG